MLKKKTNNNMGETKVGKEIKKTKCSCGRTDAVEAGLDRDGRVLIYTGSGCKGHLLK